MLPYLEQTAIYNAINFNQLNQSDPTYEGSEANTTACGARIARFLCLSAPLFPGIWYNNIPAPTNNYFASVGSSVQWQGTVTNKPNGVFWYNGAPISNRDVNDGTSKTIAFSEWRTGDNNDSILSMPQDVIEIGTTYLGGSGDNAGPESPVPQLHQC
jgi:hypothetical protein